MIELLALGSTILLTNGLTLGPTGRGGRVPFPTDFLVVQMVHGEVATPVEGGKVGDQAWKPVQANKDGWFEGLRGYAAFRVEEPKQRVAVLRAIGHGMVYVNGEPRGGDPYGFGYLELPILLKAGGNDLIFGNGRGRLHAEVLEAKGKAQFGGNDLTMPDFVIGKTERMLGALPILNTSTTSLANLTITAKVGTASQTTRLPVIQGTSVRKPGFEFPAWSPKEPGKVKVELVLMQGKTELDKKEIELSIKGQQQTRNVTFRSEIDGSVQYYGLVPPTDIKPGKGIVLTVHGASVEASGQAAAYSPKNDFWIVAATNRRPYGFDWEDWGRMDALEVLEHAIRTLQADPKKTYLTGHSMGGHGTWILGATFPGRFGAIAPSAGWRSFFTYGGKPREDKEWQEPFNRATNGCDLDVFMDNLWSPEIYILHGDADDNVPVTEARAMKEALGKMGKRFGYYEEPKAGHWWDGDRSPGADCVDWPAIFEMFQKEPLDPWVNSKLRFVTVNPVVNSGLEGFDILVQEKRMAPSRFEVERSSQGYQVITKSVLRMRVPGRTLSIDGEDLHGKSGSFEKRRGQWFPVSGGMGEYGPLKEAMTKRFALIFGTKGSEAENQWSFAKARFDSEQFLYRGNGDVAVMSDDEFLRRGAPGTVVLYGNSETNAAWVRIMGTNALFQADHKAIQIPGGKPIEGNFGFLATVPRGRNVVLVGGTSLEGMKACDRLPVFVSGVGYPDFTVFRTDVASTSYAGVVCTGYWGAGPRVIERLDR